jgi:hypothetical protein
MAAFDLMREYAETKGVADYVDIGNAFKPDFKRQGITDYVKKAWYFLKHAKGDTDKELDTSRLAGVNLAFTCINCLNYKLVFNETTGYMNLILSYAASESPELLKQDAREEALAKLKAFMHMTQQQRKDALRYGFSIVPELARERTEDTALARNRLAGRERIRQAIVPHSHSLSASRRIAAGLR